MGFAASLVLVNAAQHTPLRTATGQDVLRARAIAKTHGARMHPAMQRLTSSELSYLAHLLQVAPADATNETERRALVQIVNNAQRARDGLPPRVTDEQLAQLRREALREGKHELVDACDEAAFAQDPDALKRCSRALRMRALQAPAVDLAAQIEYDKRNDDALAGLLGLDRPA